MINTKIKRSAAYKVRKSGNSDVVTIPAIIKEKLGIEEGDSLAFIINESGSISIEKEQPKIDVDKAMKKALSQYHDLLNDLVDL